MFITVLFAIAKKNQISNMDINKINVNIYDKNTYFIEIKELYILNMLSKDVKQDEIYDMIPHLLV